MFQFFSEILFKTSQFELISRFFEKKKIETTADVYNEVLKRVPFPNCESIDNPYIDLVVYWYIDNAYNRDFISTGLTM